MRLRGLLWFNALFFIMPVALLAGAVVEGRVELPKSYSAPVQAKRYEIVTKGGVLSTQPPVAVVYLDGIFPSPGSLPTKEITQKDLTFVPALLPIRVGTKVEFPNLDDTYHNIFSYSPAKRFDLGRYRRDERPIPAQIFDKQGLVTLRCDIHDHMRGTDPGFEYFVFRDDRYERTLSTKRTSCRSLYAQGLDRQQDHPRETGRAKKWPDAAR